MSEKPFKAGDVVILISGGLEMNIRSVLPGNLSVDCVYFDGKDFIKRNFDDFLLVKVK